MTGTRPYHLATVEEFYKEFSKQFPCAPTDDTDFYPVTGTEAFP